MSQPTSITFKQNHRVIVYFSVKLVRSVSNTCHPEGCTKRMPEIKLERLRSCEKQTWTWSSVRPFTTSSTGTAAPAHPLLATAGIDNLEPRRRAFLMANMLLQRRRMFARNWYLSKPKLDPFKQQSRRLPFTLVWVLASSRLEWHPAAPYWSPGAFLLLLVLCWV